MQKAQSSVLVGELRFHMPRGTAKKFSMNQGTMVGNDTEERHVHMPAEKKMAGKIISVFYETA